MRDLNAILEALDCLETGEAAPAVATVVEVAGSVYRRPGARMFVYPDGRRVGTVSGGCLEADVVHHALNVLRTGTSEYILYDKRRSNGDVVAELGCNGSVGILVEPAVSPGAWCALQFLASAGVSRRRGAIATVFRTEGTVSTRPGDRFVRGGCEAGSAIPRGGDFTPLLDADLETALRSDKAFHRGYANKQGAAHVLIEPLLPPVALLLCGAGQDAAPLMQVARLLGWEVIMPDSPSDPELLPFLSLTLPDKMQVVPPFSRSDRDLDTPLTSTIPPVAVEPAGIDSRTVAVVMTHNYSKDLAWLRNLLPTSVGYIGLLGPCHRSLRLLSELQAGGCELTPERLARLHSPVGLDLGAETPEEIAVAIVAEIQAVINGRSGGRLRERAAPIHFQPELEAASHGRVAQPASR